MRTPEEIREEMTKLNALQPQYCKTSADWLKVVKHNELYKEWIEALRVQEDEQKPDN
jgi:hypothetical protein